MRTEEANKIKGQVYISLAPLQSKFLVRMPILILDLFHKRVV